MQRCTRPSAVHSLPGRVGLRLGSTPMAIRGLDVPGFQALGLALGRFLLGGAEDAAFASGMAALARTQGANRFSSETLTNPSGFAGIDGLFRFRSDGTNERGLAVMKVTTGGGVQVAGSPKSFGA